MSISQLINLSLKEQRLIHRICSLEKQFQRVINLARCLEILLYLHVASLSQKFAVALKSLLRQSYPLTTAIGKSLATLVAIPILSLTSATLSTFL